MLCIEHRVNCFGRTTLGDKPLVSHANCDRLEQLGEHASEAEVMKAHRRQLAEKKYSKVKESLVKAREHRLADLKVLIPMLLLPQHNPSPFEQHVDSTYFFLKRTQLLQQLQLFTDHYVFLPFHLRHWRLVET